MVKEAFLIIRMGVLLTWGVGICFFAPSSYSDTETNSDQVVRIDPEAILKKGFIPSELVEGVWEYDEGNNIRRLKVIKDGHFAIRQTNSDTGDLMIYFGGSYTFSGDVYTETVEFGNSIMTRMINKSFTYRISLNGDRLHYAGIGSTVREEDWSRAISPEHNKLVLDSIVLVKVNTKNGMSCGSGFITEMDGKKYVITNQHVVDDVGSLKITPVASQHKNIIPLSLELCKTQDLVRMHITNEIPALFIESNHPPIGDKVRVYGDSDGGGVVTEIKGKVLGVGPNLVEVDAEFVQGNSGGPILNSDAKVIGVATYATFSKDPEDWLSADTRFQEVRRYGIRIGSYEWIKLPPEKFTSQLKFLSDAEHATIVFATTYMSIRGYAKLPYYRHQRETAEGKEIAKQYNRQHENMRSCRPTEKEYYSSKMYKTCAEYYKMASKVFSDLDAGYRVSLSRAHKGYLMISKMSVKNIQSVRASIIKARFASDHLQDKADELVGICDYIIEWDQE